VRFKIASCIFAGALVLAACGGDDDDTASSDSTAADSGATTTADSGTATNALVSTASTDLGDVLVNADGMTLYVFTNDTEGVSTCTGDCAGTWPALTVDSADLPEGLDAGIYSVATNEDGTFQLAANDQPLYTFSGDTAAGDTNGQGIGGIWFVVGPDGQMIQDAAGGAGGGAGATTMPPTTADDGY
jgi:predicted lipoprotein with Yx(FWY)xxD motif